MAHFRIKQLRKKESEPPWGSIVRRSHSVSIHPEVILMECPEDRHRPYHRRRIGSHAPSDACKSGSQAEHDWGGCAWERHRQLLLPLSPARWCPEQGSKTVLATPALWQRGLGETSWVQSLCQQPQLPAWVSIWISLPGVCRRELGDSG